MDRRTMIEAMVPNARGNPEAMARLVFLLQEEGQLDRAVELAREVHDHPLVDPALAQRMDRFLMAAVPRWHFRIVRDAARNAAYDAALRRAIRPGMRVLEIGTGTGILAMMAARAGAEVITCEANTAVADAATHVIEANGYSDRVRVIARSSLELDAETDLGGRADLLVSEIVGNDLLGEDVLPAHEHAVRHLLKPGAPVIPGRGMIRVALASYEGAPMLRPGTVESFDLSPFNRLLPRIQRVAACDADLALRSDAADLFSFDFATAVVAPPARAATECVALGGTATGIAQWIALDMGSGNMLENPPDSSKPRSAWAVRFLPFREPVETEPGQRFTIAGAHDRHNVTIHLG